MKDSLKVAIATIMSNVVLNVHVHLHFHFIVLVTMNLFR